jgi:hypothetical protein
MFDEDVKLPWTGILLDQLDANDPEDAEVRAIILRVQQRAAAIQTTSIRPHTPSPEARIPSQIDDLPPERPRSHPGPVTIFSEPVVAKPDGRSRRRKYASRADQQRAYRERKAALQAA